MASLVSQGIEGAGLSSPAVSVVIPTYNRAHMLSRAVLSVIRQTSKDWELLIIDDGSTDTTEQVVQSFSDLRIRYVRHESNRGAQAARNTGIRMALGEYIAFLDSDDEWHRTKLERQLNAFLLDDVGDLGVVLCDATVADDDATGKNVVIPVRGKPIRGWVYEDLLARRLKGPKTSRILVRRSAVTAEHLFDESLPASQDTDFLIRLAANYRFDYISEPLVIVHYHSEPRVSNNELLGKEALLRKFSSVLSERPGVHRQRHLSLAIGYWRHGDVRGARRHIRHAIKASPLSASCYLWLIFAACGQNSFGRFLELRRLLATLRRRYSKKR